MGIVLPRELEEAIKQKVASKAYDSAEHVIAEALKLLVRRDEALLERNQKLQWLRQAFVEGLASEDLGPLTRDEFREAIAGRQIKRADPVK
jgi:putative addiction module CopG family antidote